jgi:hypothetical protein
VRHEAARVVDKLLMIGIIADMFLQSRGGKKVGVALTLYDGQSIIFQAGTTIVSSNFSFSVEPPTWRSHFLTAYISKKQI